MELVEDIWLDSNEIVKIEPYTFFELNSIIGIHLQANKIEIIERNVFFNLSNSLELIDLSSNRILKYNPNFLNKIILFNLSHNFLDGLSVGAFKGLESLVKLDLSSNLINLIDKDFLNYLFSLDDLRLGNNGLKLIENFAFKDFSFKSRFEL